MESCVSESSKIFTEEIKPLMDQNNLKKIVVICKHLCGTGTDYCIRFLEELTELGKSSNFEFLGAVFATCCSHKIPFGNGGEDLAFFQEFYREGWNGEMGEDRLKEELEQMCKWVSWRNTSLASTAKMGKLDFYSFLELVVLFRSFDMS